LLKSRLEIEPSFALVHPDPGPGVRSWRSQPYLYCGCKFLINSTHVQLDDLSLLSVMDPENYRSAKYHVPKVAREKALKTCKTYTAYATALLPEFFKPSVTLFCTCTGSIKGKAADGNVRASLPKEALAVFLGETLLHFFHCSPLSRANLPLQTTAAVLAVSTLRSTCLLRVRSSVCFVQSICIFRLNERNSSSYPQRSRRNVTTA
jgi:hypothetical protein